MKHMQILVIRPGAIGDVLLAFPVLQTLRKEYVNVHITLVSNSVVLPLALAYKIADEAFDYQDISWSELFSEAGIRSPSLRNLLAQTDLIICWLRDSDHIVEQNISKAGVKHVIVAPGRPPEGACVHIVDYLAGTVGYASRGGSGVETGRGCLHRPLWGHTTPGATIRIPTESSASTPSTRPQPLPPLLSRTIAVHPGSGSPTKCWSPKYFADVIERLWQQNLPVLLLAGPADVERLETILTRLSPLPKPELLQILTNRPLLEVAYYLQNCRCYLGNDSGITHLAAMLSIPTIAIFGPSDPAIWHPVGPTVKVIRERSLEQVTVDLIMEAINSFI